MSVVVVSPCCSDRDWRKAFGQPSRGLTSRQVEERRKAGLSGRAVKSPNSNRGTQHRGTHTGNGALFGPHKTSNIRRLFTLRVAYTCWELRFRAGTLDLMPTSLRPTRQPSEDHNIYKTTCFLSSQLKAWGMRREPDFGNRPWLLVQASDLQWQTPREMQRVANASCSRFNIAILTYVGRH